MNLWGTTFASGGAKKAVGAPKKVPNLFFKGHTKFFGGEGNKILRGAPTGNVMPLPQLTSMIIVSKVKECILY